MGYGSYKASDWAKLRSSKGINSSSNASDIFAREFKDKYNPRFIDKRESRDSEDSPESTPIIIGFDVTGSMGYLAEEIAKNSLNKTITEIYDKQPVTNPHVMCAAFTCPGGHEGSLQVTQFEADIRVIEQLFELRVNYGGNTYSYDNLVWYFASRHTDIDCYNKRGKKGFIICIGDEICGYDDGDYLTKRDMESVFDDKDVPAHLNLMDLYNEVSERYEVFHIITDMGYRFEKALSTWENLLPGKVAVIKEEEISYLSEVITSIMQLASGKSRKSVIEQWPEETRPIVEKAIEYIMI
ncbi:hypothetical protein SAMN02910456_00349 [Ruminococcaceae bacterium YRB3002]|nr:hypothetical protein SAMN02910456_00349 [Ruminococcaceae bacterium YRB3002]